MPRLPSFASPVRIPVAAAPTRRPPWSAGASPRRWSAAKSEEAEGLGSAGREAELGGEKATTPDVEAPPAQAQAGNQAAVGAAKPGAGDSAWASARGALSSASTHVAEWGRRQGSSVLGLAVRWARRKVCPQLEEIDKRIVSTHEQISEGQVTKMGSLVDLYMDHKRIVDSGMESLILATLTTVGTGAATLLWTLLRGMPVTEAKLDARLEKVSEKYGDLLSEARKEHESFLSQQHQELSAASRLQLSELQGANGRLEEQVASLRRQQLLVGAVGCFLGLLSVAGLLAAPRCRG